MTIDGKGYILIEPDMVTIGVLGVKGNEDPKESAGFRRIKCKSASHDAINIYGDE